MFSLRHPKFLAAAALLLVSVVLRAAPPTPEKLQKQLAEATAEKYPNADNAIIYDCESVTYQPDGLEENTNEFCIKALTEAGRKNLRCQNFSFNSDYGAYTISRAEIVKPDGRRIGLDLAKNTSVAISPDSMSSNIYTRKIKVLSLTSPGLEIGDAIAVTMKYKSFKTPFPGIFSSGFGLQSNDPTIFSEVTIDAPEKLPLRSVAVKSPAGDTVKYHGEKRGQGRIVYRWTAENVPQLIPEPDMPPFRSVAQRLLVSTAKDWREISRWYYSLCRPRLDAVDDGIRAEVKKLVAGRKTDRDKAMALFQFVSQKIRYTGVDGEDQAPGFEPHDVKDTFRQRHGVCRDKAGLLVAMLELAGLKAYPALFYSSRSTVDDEVPASRFNHAVVAWENAPGKYQLMDPTCESTTEFFPAYLANQSYLVARPEGDVLRRSPAPEPENNTLGIDTVISFDPRGRLTGTSTFRFAGYDGIVYRSAFSRHREILRQAFSRRLQLEVPGAEITDFKVTPENIRDMTRPLQVVVSYSAPGALFVSGTTTPLQLPELAKHFGIAASLAKSISLDTRNHPLRFKTTAVAREKIVIALPGSVSILSLPPDVKRTAPGAEWTRTFKNSGNTIECESAFKIDSLEVAPEQYAKLRSLRREQQSDTAALPLIRTRFAALPADRLAEIFPNNDSFISDERFSVELSADLTWRIEHRCKRRILTYAGVKKYSELKIPYVPKYQSVEISAAVTTPDGKKHRLPSRHVTDMDAPWVVSAPRYPKAAVKIAVLPAVQQGAVLETCVVLSSRSGRGFFDFAMPMRNHTPAARRELTVSFPVNHNFNCSPTPEGAAYGSEKQGGRRILNWRMDDLFAVPEELAQPDLKMFVPTIFFSIGDYRDYASAADKALREAAATTSPAADRWFAEIAAYGGSKPATVRNIRDAVAKKLRAAGPDFSSMLLSDLTPPERTLHDGYGNSADRAVVLAALLERAGVKYEFVAASGVPYLQCSTKSLREYPRLVFDDILVYIPELNLYLNDTDQYAVPGSTGHASMIGLNLSSGRLVAIRPRHKTEDAVTTTFDINLHGNGSAMLNVTREFRGTPFNRQKRNYSEMTPEERRQYCEIMAARLLPEAQLEDAKFDFSGYPGRIEFKFRIGKFARPVEDKLIFELPGYTELADAIGAGDPGRITPALRKRRTRIAFKYRIKLPQGYRIDRRPQLTELGRRSSGYFTEHTTVLRDQLSIDSLLVLPPELIQPCDYVELVDLQRDLNHHFLRRIVLTGEGPRRR